MRRQNGQVAVEAALVLPLWIFLALLLIQLALLQHARILAEYAAFSAARAGSVWGLNGERMHDAALFALLPSMGDTASSESLGRTYLAASRADQRASAELSESTPVPRPFALAGLLGLVRVDVLSPTEGDLPGTERDFDDGAMPPLSLRVRYLCELRIPVANAALFYAWFAARAGVVQPGALDAPPPGAFVEGQARALEASAGLPLISLAELHWMWRAAHGDSALSGRRYFVPVHATWAQHLHSNPRRAWAMHGGVP